MSKDRKAEKKAETKAMTNPPMTINQTESTAAGEDNGTDMDEDQLELEYA